MYLDSKSFEKKQVMSFNIRSQLSSFETELINRVHAHFPNNEPTKFLFFYTKASPFGNFYPSIIIDNGIQFYCTEQYMMYHKAKLFNDDETAQKILEATTPGKCRGLGRQVNHFNETIWINNRTRIVSDGNYLKFTQHEHLKEQLLNHQDTLFVEASPTDTIWGVGLAEDDPLIKQRSTWKGLNLMGYLLTDIAYRLRNEN
ncbi:unnamed protein product [Adineta steineri]|uniref:NADAR domain-containing protein n=1 Tax=Adineta steineri TaxID=433720 RepID=A0A815DDU1_9BILA|nr:unnamed protein product [Adineta steineri]CAF3568436.1 unnamed protein product [Adineta steineri]